MSSGNHDLAQDDRDWVSQGSCLSKDPDEFFVTGADQNQAKQICRTCPVKNTCLADALDNRVEFGVWGGMTERERRRLLREYPHVKSWLPLLERSEVMARTVTKSRSSSGGAGAGTGASGTQRYAASAR